MNRLVLLALAALSPLAACGDNDPPAFADAGSGDSYTGFSTAPHTQLPLLLPHGHALLPAPQLVTITYSDYDPSSTTSVQAFGDYIVTSDWLTTVGAEYGVGHGTNQNIVIGTAPTTTIEDTYFDTLMQGLVTATTLPAPSSTTQYVYMIYVPPTVKLGQSLQGFYGYHTETSASGQRFAYAVILDDGSGLDTTTSTAAHELLEAATDPYFDDNPNGDGWYQDPPDTDPWYLIEGEAADLCDGEVLIRAGDFAVQRIWSNAAVTAGRSPCVPYDPDDIWYDVSASPATMPTVAPGTTVKFTLTGWSTIEVPEWEMTTADADYADYGAQDILPQLTSVGTWNHHEVTLTISAPTNAQSGYFGGIYILNGPFNRPWAVGFQVQ
jgi:hypothetical protein